MYGLLAGQYDNDVRDEFSRVCARTSAQHLAEHGVHPPARILDLACGTGLTAHELQGLGYSVTGVDRSDHMLALAVARESVSSTSPEFLKGDICDLPDIGPFSAATCFGDVLNHLLETRDILAMLGSAFSALSPGGWLICDTNNLETFRSKMWNVDLPPTIWRGMRLRTRCSFDEEDGLGHMECQVYKLGQDIVVHHLTERYHPEATVQQWLAETGFVNVRSFPYHPLDLKAHFPEVATMKTLWTCQKPGDTAIG